MAALADQSPAADRRVAEPMIGGNHAGVHAAVRDEWVDTVSEVLRYVQFDPEELLGKLRRDVEAAVHAGHLQDQQAGRLLKFYEEGLQGYTYLEDPSAE